MHYSSLASALASVRKRTGKKMVDFALMMGVTQASVSRWEGGKSIPTRPALLHYLKLADSSEREVLQQALGRAKTAEVDAEIELLIEETARALDRDLANLRSDEKTKTSFNRLLRDFVGRESVPLTVFQFLDLWIRYESWAEFQQLATKSVRQLEEQAGLMERSHLIGKGISKNQKRAPKEKSAKGLPKVEYDRADPRYAAQELAVTMVCPHKGKPFYVGARLTQAQFERMSFIQVPSRTCPHCLSSHIWNKKDVFLAMPASQ
jgi:transcriptional regulator with XRE-family HTH domain